MQTDRHRHTHKLELKPNRHNRHKQTTVDFLFSVFFFFFFFFFFSFFVKLKFGPTRGPKTFQYFIICIFALLLTKFVCFGPLLNSNIRIRKKLISPLLPSPPPPPFLPFPPPPPILLKPRPQTTPRQRPHLLLFPVLHEETELPPAVRTASGDFGDPAEFVLCRWTEEVRCGVHPASLCRSQKTNVIVH